MTERKRWPDHAENMRLDICALTLDNKVLHVQLHEALRRGDIVDAARINQKMSRKTDRVHELVLEAKRL